MKKKSFFLIVLMALCLNSYAQYQENIDSGRPGNAISVFTVGKNIGQIETGLSFSNNDQSYTSSTFLRFGITERIEINGGGSYLFNETDLYTPGVTSFNLGAKFNIFEGDNMMPSTAFLASVTVPSDKFETDKAFSTFLFILNYSLNERLSYTLNFGVNVDLEKSIITETDSEGNEEESEITYFEGIYTFNLSYAINDKWSTFLEAYGGFNRYVFPKIAVSMNAGFSYLVNKDFQLDFLAGHGVNTNEYLTLSTGISWRIN
ncbi:transporter [Tenacibaculum sp. M341]|uniref:transporter n=1 Tax=Tenacibaculum sp. M341 TaxID=2530339 RepID=UPI0010476102|nr:transporter [Tenacibaculum sp. M341]TCI92659.1 transporter [Tenacibaculum sp. M341]